MEVAEVAVGEGAAGRDGGFFGELEADGGGELVGVGAGLGVGGAVVFGGGDIEAFGAREEAEVGLGPRGSERGEAERQGKNNQNGLAIL